MSELEIIAKNLLMILSNAGSAIAQMDAYSQQIVQITSLVNQSIQGTRTQGYQELINQLAISKKKLDYAITSLAEVTNTGNDWITKHFSGNHMNVNQNMTDSSNAKFVFSNNDGDDILRPTRSTPRDLPSTQFGFTKTLDGMEVYDSPLEVDKYLYAQQGSAYVNFQGTCGLCSIANVLRLSGIYIGEKEIIDYAANTSGDRPFSKLCTVNSFNYGANGGTTAKERQQILDYFGVSSSIWNVKTEQNGKVSNETINDIAKWISEGRGVIISVDTGLFYDDPRRIGEGHALTVTSVEKNKYGDVTSFYILDSNQGTVKYSAWKLQEVLRSFGAINVTSQIIR